MTHRPISTSFALALTLVGCSRPTLWIGELPRSMDVADAARPVTSELDAGAATGLAAPSGEPTSTVAQDAAAPLPPPPTGVPAALTPPGDSGNPLDASTPPNDDDDAATIAAPADEPPADEPPTPTHLPAARGCPDLTRKGTYSFGDPRVRTLSVDIYIAPDARTKQGAAGPIILYFHGFGSDSNEVLMGFGQSAIDEVVQQGGVVAAFQAKFCATCGLSDEVVWYVQDDPVVDQVVACAIAQAHVDARRIHAVGFSAGGGYSVHLGVTRSDYIASVVSYSGAHTGLAQDAPDIPQDPSNHVATLLSYGRSGLDFVGLDIPMLNLQWYDVQRADGVYVMLCDHQGGHTIAEELAPHALRFLLDHSYKRQPEPYAQSIPAVFPSYCSNTPLTR